MDTQPTSGHSQPAMTSPTNTMNMNASQPSNTPQPPRSGNALLANKKLLYGLIAGVVGIVLLIVIIIVVAIQSAPPSRKDLQDAQALIRSHSRTEDRLLQPLSRGETIDTKAFADNRKELISKLGSSRAVHDEDIKRAYEQYKPCWITQRHLYREWKENRSTLKIKNKNHGKKEDIYGSRN